jgi:hypothetical protein
MILIPDNWNPEKELGDINWDNLTDADPRAQEALRADACSVG